MMEEGQSERDGTEGARQRSPLSPHKGQRMRDVRGVRAGYDASDRSPCPVSGVGTPGGLVRMKISVSPPRLCLARRELKRIRSAVRNRSLVASGMDSVMGAPDEVVMCSTQAALPGQGDLSDGSGIFVRETEPSVYGFA
jgi:hypothetical protein